jgi:hypothetical protein
MYMKMIGSRNSVPTSRNVCVDGAAAACHNVCVYGTT